MLEQRLIYEMAELRGGKTKLKALRDEYEEEIEKLTDARNLITNILGDADLAGHPIVEQELSDSVSTEVDSLGEER